MSNVEKRVKERTRQKERAECVVFLRTCVRV